MALKRIALMFTLLSSSAWAAPVSLTTADEITLSAEVEGAGEKGVLLVHGKGRTRADWASYAKKLASKGFQVVAIDLRGHGESAGSAGTDDYPKMVADVLAGVEYLKANGATHITIMGADLGANLSVSVAAENESVNNLILLSAGMNISGVKSGGALETYGQRPVLIVSSDEDVYATKSAAYLEGKAKGEKHVETLSGAGSGVRMLTRDPKLEGMVLAWLNGTFFLTKEGGGAETHQKALNTSDTTKIETTGTKFGEDREKKKEGEPMPELNLDD